jgi:hypothetical protein
VTDLDAAAKRQLGMDTPGAVGLSGRRWRIRRPSAIWLNARAASEKALTMPMTWARGIWLGVASPLGSVLLVELQPV